MNIEALAAIWKTWGHGQDMRIEYTQLPSGNRVPRYIGLGPLHCPEDAPRWRIGVIQYDANECPVLLRDYAEQTKWSERGTLT